MKIVNYPITIADQTISLSRLCRIFYTFEETSIVRDLSAYYGRPKAKSLVHRIFKCQKYNLFKVMDIHNLLLNDTDTTMEICKITSDLLQRQPNIKLFPQMRHYII